MHFGKWLDQELATRELSRAELASRIGVTPGTVSRWAHGRRTPDIPHCERIAVALGVDEGLVLERTGHTDRWNVWADELDREIATHEEQRRRCHEEIDALQRKLVALDQQVKELRAQRLSISSNTFLGHLASTPVEGIRQLRDRLIDRIPESRRDEVWQTVLEVLDEACQEQSADTRQPGTSGPDVR